MPNITKPESENDGLQKSALTAANFWTENEREEGTDMKTLFLFAVVSTILVCPARGTTQEMDLLIFEGRRLFSAGLPRLDQAFPGITFPKFIPLSTANYKGYRATWATFEKQLYLVGLEARVKGHSGLMRNGAVIPGHKFPLKVTDWSGRIVHREKSFSIQLQEAGPRSQEVIATTTLTVEKGVVIATHTDVDRKPADQDESTEGRATN